MKAPVVVDRQRQQDWDIDGKLDHTGRGDKHNRSHHELSQRIVGPLGSRMGKSPA